jgi:hypothetical protein
VRGPSAKGCSRTALLGPVHEDERGQFIEEDGERLDGVWPLPDEDQADTPVIVELGTN